MAVFQYSQVYKKSSNFVQDFGDFNFILIKSPKRKTISIAIHPDKNGGDGGGKVVIRVPKRTSDTKIREIITLRKKWILSKIELVQSGMRNGIASKTDYIKTGIFHFLGKEYALKFESGNVNQAILLQDEIFVYEKNHGGGHTIFERWIGKQALEIFSKRLAINFEIFSQKFPSHMPILKIRKMKSRWGSMTSKGVMTLNRNLIHADLNCIDYVIMHELCHILQQNHSQKFYALQEIFVPNWRELKKRL